MSSFQLSSIFGGTSNAIGGDDSNPLASIFNDSTLQKYARVYKPTEVEKKAPEKKEDEEPVFTGGKKKRKKKMEEWEAAKLAKAAETSNQSSTAETANLASNTDSTQVLEDPPIAAKKAKKEEKSKKGNKEESTVVSIPVPKPSADSSSSTSANKPSSREPVKTTAKGEISSSVPSNSMNKEKSETLDEMEDGAISQKNSDCTLFVGNISLKETVKSITKLFSDFGAVESCRMRSVPIAGAKVDEAGNQKLVKKVCVNSQKFGEQKGSYNAYLVYKDSERSSGADAVKAAVKTMNNKLLDDRHLRVDSAIPTLFDQKRTVFVGGLPYYADEEEVRKFFAEVLENADDIEGVRLVRDPETLVGKGIGYILLKDRDSALKALSRHEVTRYPH